MVLVPEKELQARRLIAQGLAASTARAELTTPHTVIKHLLALQGQNYRAGIRAIALRLRNGERFDHNSDEAVSQVLEAVASHDIVRAWPMRGTLHFLDARSARWLMKLCSPRVERAAALRRTGLGFADGDFEKAREAMLTHLMGLPENEVLERTAAYSLFDETGVNSADGRGPHLLRALGGLGEVVQGSLTGNRETFQLVDRLKVSQTEVADDQALEELGTRYINGHGPVTVADLAWWSHLTKRDCKQALESARDSTTHMIGETEYFVPTWQLHVTEKELEIALSRTYELPAFDEYLLGYSDKSFTMADEIRHEVLTKNGISWDFTVKDGAVVGRTAK